MFGPKQTTSPLTLDQVLAFDVQTFQQEFKGVIDKLNSLISAREIQNTSLITDVVPAAKDLRTWLKVFPQSMRDPDARLEASLRLRVCFAERGMFLLVTLLDAVNWQVGQLSIINVKGMAKKDIEKQKEEQAVRKMLIQFMKNVLACDETGMKFMRNWFSTLVDIVPLAYRSHNTTLTSENIEKLNLFCGQHREK